MSCDSKKRRGLRRILGSHANHETIQHYLEVYEAAAAARKGETFDRDEGGHLSREDAAQQSKAIALLGLSNLLTGHQWRGYGFTPASQAGYAAVYDALVAEGQIPPAQEWGSAPIVEGAADQPDGTLLQMACGCLWLKTPPADTQQGFSQTEQMVMLVRVADDCQPKYKHTQQTAHYSPLGGVNWLSSDPLMIVGQISPEPVNLAGYPDAFAQGVQGEVTPKGLAQAFECLAAERGNWDKKQQRQAEQVFSQAFLGCVTADYPLGGTGPRVREQHDLYDAMTASANQHNAWEPLLKVVADPTWNKNPRKIMTALSLMAPYATDPQARRNAVQAAIAYSKRLPESDRQESLRQMTQIFAYNNADTDLGMDVVSAMWVEQGADAYRRVIANSSETTPPARVLDYARQKWQKDETPFRANAVGAVLSRWGRFEDRLSYELEASKLLPKYEEGREREFTALAYGLFRSQMPMFRQAGWDWMVKHRKQPEVLAGMSKVIGQLPDSTRERLVRNIYEQGAAPILAAEKNPHADERKKALCFVGAAIPHLSGEQRTTAFQHVIQQIQKSPDTSACYRMIRESYSQYTGEEREAVAQALAKHHQGVFGKGFEEGRAYEEKSLREIFGEIAPL